MKKLLLLILLSGCISATEPDKHPIKYYGHGEWVGVAGESTTDTITVIGNDSTLRCSLIEYAGGVLKRTASYNFRDRVDGIDTGYIANDTFYMKHPIGKIGVSAYLMIIATP